MADARDVLDSGKTYHHDGSSDINIYAGSGIYNPKQDNQMKKGQVKKVMNEQKTKGQRS